MTASTFPALNIRFTDGWFPILGIIQVKLLVLAWRSLR